MAGDENTRGRLTITGELLEKIIFGMEDQGTLWFLDPGDGSLVENPGDLPLIPLPDWTGEDGFSLMRQFTDSLPPGKDSQALDRILKTGHGIFRKFKEQVSQDKALATAWHGFKHREMSRKVESWAQEWEEYIHQWSSPSEEEVPRDLVLLDFTPGTPDLGPQGPKLIQALEGALETWSKTSPWVPFWASARLRGLEGRMDSLVCTLFEDPSGEWVSWVLGEVWDGAEGRVGEILFWYTKPEARGLGLGQLALGAFMEEAQKRKLVRVLFCPPEPGAPWENTLINAGFTPQGNFFLWDGTRPSD